ncbi:MAG: dTDP-4-dehydrorhamnose reductase [Bacteriovoracaceae bacterium]|nr:dTDP-4-dehydrorhamnose reductase [Bacteriovoracaceae bacterium]
MKKILLFGATGQLGHDIQNVFKQSEDFAIIPLSSKDFYFSGDKDLQLFLKDNWPFDCLINAMAMTNTGLCEDQEKLAYKINEKAVREMAMFCQSKDIPMFHFSTDYIFDGKRDFNKRNAYSEKDQTNPLSVYGASKLAGEQALMETSKKYFIFRVSSLYGSVPGGNNFVNTMLKFSKEKDELKIVNDQFMSPTHTQDIAKAVHYFIINKIQDYGIYHCSDRGVCSWHEFTLEIMRSIGCDINVIPVSHIEFPSKLERPSYSELDNEKLSRYIKMPKWQDSLKEYLDILRSEGRLR